MRSPDALRPYQKRAVRFMLEHPNAALWLDMGLGKTVSVLTAFDVLRQWGHVARLLVIAPKWVCSATWAPEGRAWSHLRHLTFALVAGDKRQRTYALRKPADVYLVAYDNLQWLSQTLIDTYLARGLQLPFQMVVYDEVSKLKNAGGVRHAALRRFIPWIPYRVGLTGTPASNSITDVHGQFTAIDMGARLGASQKAFEDRYCIPGGYMGRVMTVLPSAAAEIKHAIADITLEMSAAEFLQLPDLILNDLWVDLPPKIRVFYDQLEAQLCAELEDPDLTLDGINKGVTSGKCRQVCNGAVYLDPENRSQWQVLHDAKLQALASVIDEARGRPVLVFYSFRHDRARILAAYPEAKSLGSELGAVEAAAVIAAWNRGEVPILVAHPASTGHGLNLQGGGNLLCWFGVPWSLELYLQAIARLRRSGSAHDHVVVHRILTRHTLDEAMVERLAAKDAAQFDLRAAIRRYQHPPAAVPARTGSV